VNDEDGIERSLKVLVDGKTCVRLIGTDLPSLEGAGKRWRVFFATLFFWPRITRKLRPSS
jgi:hypothetical protein